MKNIWRTFQRRHEDKGITGLETAIILIAFVVVATVFAFVVLTAGIFSSERGKETVYAGLAKARGTMELRGGVYANVNAGGVTQSIVLTVANAAGGEPIPIKDGTGANDTVIAYRDAAVKSDNVSYTVQKIDGDGDDLLEPGEQFTITVNVTAAEIAGISLGTNDEFTLEIQTPVGAVLDVTRTLPAQLDLVTQLH